MKTAEGKTLGLEANRPDCSSSNLEAKKELRRAAEGEGEGGRLHWEGGSEALVLGLGR